MKLLSVGYLASLLLFVLASCVSADVLVSESFDYDPGPILDQDGGEGWFEPWVVSDALLDTDFTLDVVSLERPLIYALPEGGFVNGGDRAFRFSNDSPEEVLANETSAMSRGIDEVIDADEVFFSFLYRYDGDGSETGGFINDNDFVVWWFNSAAGPQTGLKGNLGNGSGPDDFVGRVSGAFAAPQQAYAPGIDISEEAGTLNNDWLVVGKMSKAGHSDAEEDYDQFDLWINPALADEDAPLATATGAAGDALEFELSTIGLRIFNEEPGDAMIWDELRIGETWADVVGAIGDQNVTIDPVDPDPTCVVPVGGIAGDLDGDGSVGFPDLLLLSANFGAADVAYGAGDIDCSGDVGFPDFLVLSANFGTSAASTAAVPEPSAAVMIPFAICGLMLFRRRLR